MPTAPERRHPITAEQARALLGRWADAADRQGCPADAAAYRKLRAEVAVGFELDLLIAWRVEADEDVPPVTPRRRPAPRTAAAPAAAWHLTERTRDHGYSPDR